MLTIALILCYLLGLSVLLAISRKFSLAELVGYSFLIGMGLETFFLFILDVINLHYSQGVLIGLNVFVIVAINGLNYKNLLVLKDEFKTPAFELKQINFVAVFIFCIMAYLFYAVTVKCLFWPPAEHDTIGSFDKLGRIMAQEGKLKISLFQYHLEGAGGIYPPLFHGSFAYVYIFGAETSKIVTTLFFLSLLTSFYGLLRNYASSTAAMLFTFILMITPELFSHAALSLDNLPTTAYVGAGAIATFIWLDKRDVKYLWIGAIMMAFTIWIRSDTIVFTAAALAVIVIDLIRKREFKRSLSYFAIAVAPFIMWTLYLKLKLGVAQAGKFDLHMGYNTQRMDLVGGYVKAFLFGGRRGAVDGGQLYGLGFMLFFIMLFINVAAAFWIGLKEVMAKTRKIPSFFVSILSDKAMVLIFLLVSFALYFTVFYLINEKVQNAPISSLMESSFKRGLFCFIPITLFYACTNQTSTWLFEKLERFRNPA
ncbi:MAG: hypothetical protein JWO06_98 [Bacteroidota bacterium]|nr:hypothetical protein [Bacteroidota bacterium]